MELLVVSDPNGFGFMEQEDRPGVFAHCSTISTTGLTSLNEGDQILFDIGQGL